MLETRVSAGRRAFLVEFESAETIDEEGIAVAVRRALARGVLRRRIGHPMSQGHRMSNAYNSTARSARHTVYAPETIINGDELVPLISLASIAAKVIRDRRMVEFSKQYPLYGFEKHKGYGTAMHHEMLKKHEFCDIHRRSFLHLDFIHTWATISACVSPLGRRTRNRSLGGIKVKKME